MEKSKYFTTEYSSSKHKTLALIQGNFLFFIPKSNLNIRNPMIDANLIFTKDCPYIVGIVVGQNVLLQNGNVIETKNVCFDEQPYIHEVIAYALKNEDNIPFGFDKAKIALQQYLRYGKDGIDENWTFNYINPSLPKVVTIKEIEEKFDGPIVIADL